MQLAEIRHIAYTFPEQLEICWDKIDANPEYKTDFEVTVTAALKLLPALEDIHTKLSNGEHVVLEGESTQLNPDVVAEYKDLLEEELFSAYQMLAMWEKYVKVNDVINT